MKNFTKLASNCLLFLFCCAGDQAGVGKTREACIIILNMLMEIPDQQKVLYVSCSAGPLLQNLQREFDILCGNQDYKVCEFKSKKLPQKGILFTTYSTLRGKNQDLFNLFEICKWLSRDFNGCVSQIYQALPHFVVILKCVLI